MIAPEGYPFVLIPLCAGVVCVVLGWPVLGWVLVGLGGFSLFFFRNPPRSCSAPGDVACSPADGKVLIVGDAPPELIEQGLPRQISIFMSVFDVHVNRAPIDASLKSYSYNPGRKLVASKDKASLVNEQNLSVWNGTAGTLAVKQIAGLVARRIVFDHLEGSEVRRGDRIGLIRFGSRLDVLLPADAEPLVQVGDRVRAGETPLARMDMGGDT
jgi:phosphatidylserine decarboxylase